MHIAVSQKPTDPKIDLKALSVLLEKAALAWGLPVPTVTGFTSRIYPKGAAIVTFSRRLPAGALGYHIKTRTGGYTAICTFDPRYAVEVVYHEALEMLVDPDGDKFQLAPMLKGIAGFPAQVNYLVELCDPIERTVGAFITPAFYAQPYLEPGGYISWVSPGSDGSAHWYQAASDRHGKITVKDLGRASAMNQRERNRLLK